MKSMQAEEIKEKKQVNQASYRTGYLFVLLAHRQQKHLHYSGFCFLAAFGPSEFPWNQKGFVSRQPLQEGKK